MAEQSQGTAKGRCMSRPSTGGKSNRIAALDRYFLCFHVTSKPDLVGSWHNCTETTNFPTANFPTRLVNSLTNTWQNKLKNCGFVLEVSPVNILAGEASSAFWPSILWNANANEQVGALQRVWRVDLTAESFVHSRGSSGMDCWPSGPEQLPTDRVQHNKP